jgi:alkylmercury lyase
VLETKLDLRDLAKGALRSSQPFAAAERRLLRAGQRALVDGAPVSVERLGQLANLSSHEVAAVFERFPGLAHLDGEGRVVGLLGLSVQCAPHRFDATGRVVYTWCAWDSLFIPRIIGMTARVASNCPVTSALIRLIVAPDGVREVSPADVRVSFLLGGDRKSDRGVVGPCCPLIYFLSSARASDRWLANHPACLSLTIEDAWEVGRLFVDEIVFGAATDSRSESR